MIKKIIILALVLAIPGSSYQRTND